MTRAKLNALCGATQTTAVTTVTTPPTQPVQPTQSTTVTTIYSGGGGGSSSTATNGVTLLKPAANDVLRAGSSYVIKWETNSATRKSHPTADIVLVAKTDPLCDPFGCGMTSDTRPLAWLFGARAAHAAGATTLVIASGVSLTSAAYTWNIPSDILTQVSAYQNSYKIFFTTPGTTDPIFPYTDNQFTIQ